jgi:hypothetical protein
MTTALATNDQAPSQSLTVTESSRTLAETQAALTVAKASPRDQVAAVDRIMTACQRQRLAENAAYEFTKGGTGVRGASITLLEAIAQQWGNIAFGFRELSRRAGESTVEAFAWDQETNARSVKTIIVPHKIGLKGGKLKPLTDPREIKDWLANQAQRVVRTCLQAVIPRDIVEDAVDECTRTLTEKSKVTPDSLKKLLDAFAGMGVTKPQIEARIQRNLDSISPAQLANMRRIHTSIKDGMSSPGDWFEQPASQAAPSTLQEALGGKKETVAAK